jgi:hypothetical protein
MVLAAATSVVQLADIRCELAYEHGLTKQTELRMGAQNQVVHVPMPPEVVATIDARDAYVRAAERLHKTDDVVAYVYDTADLFFVYGDFEHAKPRFRSIYKGQCGKDQIAFRAWTKLITMAAREDDVTEARALALADTHSTCDLSGRHDLNVHFDPAPVAVFRGAFAFRRASEDVRAATLLEKFIREYGADEILDKLKKEEPKQYDERIVFLTQAYNELMTARYAGFDYRGAADVALRAAKDARLTTDARLESARNALILLRAVGDRTALDGAWRLSITLKSSPEVAAKNEYIAASDAVLPSLWDKDKRIPSVALDVAWDVAKHSDATKARVWLSRVLDSWQALDEPKRAAVCDRAAEAEYVLADASIGAVTPTNVSTFAMMFEKLAKTCPSSPFVAIALAREGALYELLGKAYEDRMLDAYTRAVDAASASNASHATLTHARRKLATAGRGGAPVGLPTAMPFSGAAAPLPVLP